MKKYKNTEFPHLSSSACEARVASRDELSAYIDKELPAWKRYLIQQHLKKCTTCSHYVEGMQKTDIFLRRSGEVETPPDFLAGVIARVSAVTQHHRSPESLGPRLGPHPRIPFQWGRRAFIFADKLRDNIQTRSPIYIFALTFCVFTMVGVTLYPTRSARFGQPVHAWQKGAERPNEKLISFEVIRPEPPKRLLTTALQQK